MAKSSIHIQASVNGSIGHNSRENFSHSVVFTDEENKCDTIKSEAYKVYRSELKKRSEAYTNRTGQKLQKSTVTQLSAIINLEQHHTLKDLEPIKTELEKKFNTKIYQMAIHRDEGKLVSKKDETELYSGKDFYLNTKNNELYFDKKFTKKINMKDYEVIKNYHAHIEMMGLDNDGQAIRQKMNKVVLKQLQTFTANTLQMERGKETKSYTKEQMKEIVAIVGKKTDYKNTTLYAERFNEVARELGYFTEKKKRQDTHKFKDAGAERENAKRDQLAKQNTEEDSKQAKQKDLKEEMKEVRAMLKDADAVRENYAQLEKFSRTLRQQIKDKDLTIGELKEQIDLFKEMFDAKDEENSNLKITNDKLEKEVEETKSSLERSIQKVGKLEEKNSKLKAEMFYIKKENLDLKKFASAVKKIVNEKLANSPIGNLEKVLAKIKEYFNIKNIEPVEVQKQDDAEHVKLNLLYEELSTVETKYKGKVVSIVDFIHHIYEDGYTELRELKTGGKCLVNESIDQKYNLKEEKFAEYANLYIKEQAKFKEVSTEIENEDTLKSQITKINQAVKEMNGEDVAQDDKSEIEDIKKPISKARRDRS